MINLKIFILVFIFTLSLNARECYSNEKDKISYFDLDAETIFVICDDHLEKLLTATTEMILDVKAD